MVQHRGTSVPDISLPVVHALTDVATALSCLVLGAAMVRLLFGARALTPETRRATTLMAVFVIACALARLGDLGALRPELLSTALEVAATMVMAVTAVTVWPIVRRLRTQPSRRELLEANRRLAAEDEARRVQIDRLTDLNVELERRVAERTRDLAESKRRFEIALDGSPISVAQQDRDLRYTWIYNPPPIFASGEFVGRLAEEVVPLATARSQDALKRRVLETGVAERFEVSARIDERTYWFEGRVEALIEDGETVGVVSVGIDVTRHKEYEQQLRLVMRELTHRSKNLLAVVIGIARQTAETVGDLATFTDRFVSRLHALSGAHELLVQRSWLGVGLRDLVGRELGDETDAMRRRVRIDGGEVTLGPEAAQNLALALHELIANAHLHGALSTAEGAIELSWSEPASPSGGLDLVWRERGGPPAVLTDRHGYGRVLLERLIPRAIEGDAELSAEVDGIRYRLHIPATRLIPPT